MCGRGPNCAEEGTSECDHPPEVGRTNGNVQRVYKVTPAAAHGILRLFASEGPYAPSPVFTVGMLSGFCGALVIPTVANFNLVPATLLEMQGRYGPIKAQLPTAGLVLLVNIGVMYAVAF